jgi:non-structural maintenance of chromosomes element 4
LKQGDIEKQENATDKMVKYVASLLKEHAPINLFEFVINPVHFGQTIENIFYLSFNVRDARAKIELNEEGVPIVYYVDALTEEEMELDNKQCVLEMTMDYWKVRNPMAMLIPATYRKVRDH